MMFAREEGVPVDAPALAARIRSAVAEVIRKHDDAAGKFFSRRAYSAPAALTGVPAVALPCGFDSAGLPLSLQLMGRPFEDATVLRAAHAYEQVTEWHRRRPRLDEV
jgi:Asp-tRNA(Asn)/Glu-tRNA(Gln) amidotransferase A subunit family amidase